MKPDEYRFLANGTAFKTTIAAKETVVFTVTWTPSSESLRQNMTFADGETPLRSDNDMPRRSSQISGQAIWGCTATQGEAKLRFM
jgi:hypothetical protein